MENGVPNLDCFVSAGEIQEWIQTLPFGGVRPIRAARILFPGRPEGYVRAAKDVYHYASNKLTAMGCRARGDISAACMYEGICDRIYAQLPEYARW